MWAKASGTGGDDGDDHNNTNDLTHVNPKRCSTCHAESHHAGAYAAVRIGDTIRLDKMLLQTVKRSCACPEQQQIISRQPRQYVALLHPHDVRTLRHDSGGRGGGAAWRKPTSQYVRVPMRVRVC